MPSHVLLLCPPCPADAISFWVGFPSCEVMRPQSRDLPVAEPHPREASGTYVSGVGLSVSSFPISPLWMGACSSQSLGHHCSSPDALHQRPSDMTPTSRGSHGQTDQACHPVFMIFLDLLARVHVDVSHSGKGLSPNVHLPRVDVRCGLRLPISQILSLSPGNAQLICTVREEEPKRMPRQGLNQVNPLSNQCLLGFCHWTQDGGSPPESPRRVSF